MNDFIRNISTDAFFISWLITIIVFGLLINIKISNLNVYNKIIHLVKKICPAVWFVYPYSFIIYALFRFLEKQIGFPIPLGFLSGAIVIMLLSIPKVTRGNASKEQNTKR